LANGGDTVDDSVALFGEQSVSAAWVRVPCDGRRARIRFDDGSVDFEPEEAHGDKSLKEEGR
jgi:hypothetical protein